MSWRIRPARASDGAAIVAVQTTAWQAAYANLLPADRLAALDEPERQERSAAMWDGYADSHPRDAAVLVADVNEVVAAFAVMSSADGTDLGSSVCELNVFHVHPAQWGTGLAKALMAATIDWMHDAAYQRASLWTLRDASRARRFYEREGWAHDGRTQTELAKPLWRDLEIPQVRYVTDRPKSRS